MSEIINIQELKAIINAAPVTPDHTALLSAINGRYPETQFKLVAERDGRSWDNGIIDAVGNRVTNNIHAWVDQELEKTGNSVENVWKKYKDAGLMRTEWSGSALYLSSPYGAEADAYFQMEIEVGQETTCSLLFDTAPYFPPEDRFDLITGPCFVFADSEKQILSSPKYNFDSLLNVRQFLRDLAESEKAIKLLELPEMEKKVCHIQDIVLGPNGGQTSKTVPFLELDPGWFTRTPPALRLFQDWNDSSAGRSGELFCNHWWINANKWVNKDDGLTHYYLCPQWADADGGVDLPKIEPDWEANPYTVMGSLADFDAQVGFPFAWYGYMLHGNRISHSAGGVVARAIREGKIRPLPECDEQVLLRWNESTYGF